MRKIRVFLIAFLTSILLVTSQVLQAQNVNINLRPGWNWIGFPGVDTLGIEQALGGYVPVEGDILKGRNGFISYSSGIWFGDMTSMVPGSGYMYYSKKQENTTFTIPVVSHPSVFTNDAFCVTEEGALLSGFVTFEGVGAVTERGMCWSTTPNPTVEGSHLAIGSGSGGFSTTLTNLESATYYVRAYAMNSSGTSYGNEVNFTILQASTPTVTTSVVADITQTSAACGGDVTSGGNASIIERGICWSMRHNPTVSDSHLASGSGLGSFICNMVGLAMDTTYYVRAYATNRAGTSYGNEVSFKTLITGALPGVFCINASGDQVNFSQGNLQYRAHTNTWRFAEHQWDYVGDGNTNISSTYDGWIDLFGWGTSGYNHGATCYQPWSTSSSFSDYYAYGSSTNNLYTQPGKADWGYNRISNGGNIENQWRSLTGGNDGEWNYLLNVRTTASGIRYAKAQVNGVNGVILVPDGWNVSTYALNNTNNKDADYTTNVISRSTWMGVLEPGGCVFLPAAGYRHGTSVNEVGASGNYFTSTYDDDDYVKRVFFSGRNLLSSYDHRYYGQSVRLVRFALKQDAFPPTVTTGTVTNVAQTSAACGGEVTSDGNVSVIERGICWSTAHNPTTSDSHAASGMGSGSYMVNMTGLTANTTYYVRAYATNNVGTSYGNEVSFTTLIIGALPGLFCINASGDQVYFSQGNLQYQANTNTWRFAERQWDYVGDGNTNISSTYGGWIDLFGWGTSGYNHGATCYQPWSTSSSFSDYYAYGSSTNNLYSQSGKADWGYNRISNGGNVENQWRSLTGGNDGEWNYVLNGRTTASGIRYAKAQVNGVNGVILVPDNWNVSTYALNNTNNKDADYTTNVISQSTWTGVLEPGGCVFLPAAGYRHGTSVNFVGSEGNYFTSTYDDDDYVKRVFFSGRNLLSSYDHRYNGQSVRLVHPAR